MEYLTENVRYVLWSAGVKHDRWARHLSSWIGCNEGRASRLLRDGGYSAQEQAAIARVNHLDEEDLVHGRLVELARGVDVLHTNLDHLIDRLPRGQKQELAGAVGVKPGTVSDWLAGRQRPEEANLQAIRRFFDLPEGTDLKCDPVFLNPEPIGQWERRAWLRQRVEDLDGRTLDELFPALWRLLEE